MNVTKEKSTHQLLSIVLCVRAPLIDWVNEWVSDWLSVLRLPQINWSIFNEYFDALISYVRLSFGSQQPWFWFFLISSINLLILSFENYSTNRRRSNSCVIFDLVQLFKWSKVKKIPLEDNNFDRVSNNKQSDPVYCVCVQNGMAFLYVCVKLSINLICMNSLLSMKILKYAKKKTVLSFSERFEAFSIVIFHQVSRKLFHSKMRREKTIWEISVDVMALCLIYISLWSHIWRRSSYGSIAMAVILFGHHLVRCHLLIIE